MSRPPFRLHHIALLRAVMQSQTLTEAARRMHISQPAVSKQIKQLQEDLGFALFERQGHKLLPTFEARAMLDQVQRVSASLDVLNRLAKDLGNERRGHLQIGCIASVASHLLPAALRVVIGDGNQAIATVHTGNTAQVVEWVETQQVDIGVALSVRGAEDLGFQKLMDWRLECLLPPGHALLKKQIVKPQDLVGFTVIAVELPVLDWPDPTVARWDMGLDAVVVRVDASGVACRMVEAGLGVAVADSLTVAAYAQPPLAMRPLDHVVQTSIGFYMPRYRPRSRMLDALVAALEQAAKSPQLLTEKRNSPPAPVR